MPIPVLAVQVARIEGNVEVIRAKLEAVEQSSDIKHHQNRLDINELKQGQRETMTAVSQINLRLAKQAGWTAGAAAVGGIIVAFVTKAVEHLWK